MYDCALTATFASEDGSEVVRRGGSFELPFGWDARLMFTVFEESVGGKMADSADRLCPRTPDIVAELHVAVQAR